MRRLLLGCFAVLASSLLAQQPAEPPPAPGTVLFSTEQARPPSALPPAQPAPELTAEERNAPTFTRYDLDVHLVPATSRITVLARLEVRNDGASPLRAIPLQLSSTLRWESIGLADGGPAVFTQHLLDTDADHTGRANEAIVTLPQPLATGASVALTAFYTGDLPASAQRLERIGAPVGDAALADWDGITSELTALRGFGNVLWYPVAAEPVFLGDGAKLFQAVGRSRLRQAAATIRLRLTVEYVGDPPDAAIFCGHRELLVGVSENKDVPVAESPGIATVEFVMRPLGFRSPSLFVTDRAATVTADTLIAAVTEQYDALPSYAAAASLVKPLLVEWLGPAPLTQLELLDHRGQPFEDGAFAVLPLRASAADTLAPGLLHSLTHAWFRSSRPWLEEGVAQLMSLLWLERTQGREAAVLALQDAARTLSLVEPAEPGQTGQALAPLTKEEPGASDDVFLRSKAAAVLWMLRSLAGEDALRQTLLVYRDDAKVDADPQGFARTLERLSHKDLRWFFDDWVYRDRGLPDLTIVNVTPRELPSVGGKPASWLVAVEVRNEGDAAVEVPVIVRSGTLTASTTLRIAARSSASTRILFEAQPEEVLVNDGTVPEMRTSTHSIQLKERSYR